MANRLVLVRIDHEPLLGRKRQECKHVTARNCSDKRLLWIDMGRIAEISRGRRRHHRMAAVEAPGMIARILLIRKLSAAALSFQCHFVFGHVLCIRCARAVRNGRLWRESMKHSSVTISLAVAFLATNVSISDTAPCLMVTLTGTQGGPQSFNGLAGAGTLVRFGDDADECGAVKLQFDAGRGTTMRLSQLKVGPEQLDAVFFTHMHNDHTEGFADLV